MCEVQPGLEIVMVVARKLTNKVNFVLRAWRRPRSQLAAMDAVLADA